MFCASPRSYIILHGCDRRAGADLLDSVEVWKWTSSQQLSTKQKVGHFCHFNTPWAAGFDVVCELFSDIYTCKLVKRCNYESHGSYLNLGESGYCFLERFSVSSLWRFTAPSTSCLKNLEEEPAGSGSYTWRSTGHWTLRVIEFNERGFSWFWCFPGTRSTFFFGFACAGASELESFQSKIWNLTCRLCLQRAVNVLSWLS